MSIDYNEYITVKCNNCGEEMGFYPHRVLFLGECDCGKSKYWGNPLRDWPKDNYGDFTFVKKESLVIKISSGGPIYG